MPYIYTSKRNLTSIDPISQLIITAHKDEKCAIKYNDEKVLMICVG